MSWTTVFENMDGITLDKFLRQDPHTSKHFAGVFAADTLPSAFLARPVSLIVNSDPISKPGTHWLAITIDACGNGEYFDSYGLKPFVPHHKRFLSSACKTWKYNHVDLQSIQSSVCGHYCAMYLLFKSHGYTLKDFVNCFTNDCGKNDTLVEKMFLRYSKNVLLCDDVSVKQTQSCCKRFSK